MTTPERTGHADFATAADDLESRTARHDATDFLGMLLLHLKHFNSRE
jgi:hypothetical protein